MLNSEKKSLAKIISSNIDGITLCASAARISTQQGTALEIWEAAKNNDNNVSLIKKVLLSGHKSVIEHLVFNIAFNNVSVFVEQFIIEFRLASFTVKSRRYVDFRNSGFYTGSFPDEKLKSDYCSHMKDLFAVYDKLIGCGVAREDARFVLPYCFYSNFYCTCNARELMHIICSMIYGKGRNSPEIYELGLQLKEQFEQYLPGIIETEAMKYARDLSCPEVICVEEKREVEYNLSLLSYTSDAGSLLANEGVAGLCNQNNIGTGNDRSKELINYVFAIGNVSMAALTHITRHRMHNLIVPGIQQAVRKNSYIVPPAVKQKPEAYALYSGAFGKTEKFINMLLKKNMADVYVPYCVLSGHTVDIVTNMNGRELAHFINLRTCSRAQWEVRNIAVSMIREVKKHTPGVFTRLGPCCYTSGHCPEGRMSCSKQDEMCELFAGI